MGRVRSGTPAPTRAGLPAPPPPAMRVRAALSAEWIKLRSLRSVPVTLVLAAVFCIGLADLVCSNYAANWSAFSAAKRAAFDPLDVNFGFVQIGAVFFGALGALVVTNEYGNGLIRATFAATPQRVLVLAAKAALLGLVALSGSAAICGAAFLTGQGELSGRVPSVGPGAPGVLAHVVGAVLYLTAAGLIGLLIGVLARGSALAVSGVFGVLLVLPTMVDSLPQGAVWRHTVPYLPSNLGAALWHTHSGGLVAPTTAAILLPVYLVVLGAAAVARLRGTDA